MYPFKMGIESKTFASWFTFLTTIPSDSDDTYRFNQNKPSAE